MKKETLTRRDLLQASGALGLVAAVPFSLTALPADARPQGAGSPKSPKLIEALSPLKPPASGPIPVAFLISKGAVLIDFAGPWEVFQSADIPGRDMMDNAFDSYTVAETSDPVTISGGMKIVPNYTFQNAPAPKVVVIPAQSDPTNAALQWIRRATKTADLTMSVCTGAFVLAKAGLLDGKSATTHHSAYKHFADEFPKVRLVRGVRFVDEGNIATAGGLTCGSDLAMHIVERYFGRKLAEDTAYYLEYQSVGWKDPSSNMVYARPSKTG